MLTKNSCLVKSYHFLYYYDHFMKKFIIKSSLNSYTVSELSWDFIEDYEIFNFILQDIKIVRFVEKKSPDGDFYI